MVKIEQKVKANPLPFWSILATFFQKQRLNFRIILKTFCLNQKQRRKRFRITFFENHALPNVVLGLLKPFLKCRKNGENRAKSKG